MSAYQTQAQTVRELSAEAQLADSTPGRRSFLELSALLAATRGELRAAVHAVRAVDPDFFRSLPLLDPAAAQAAPLVYLLATPAGGLALIVRGDQPVDVVWLAQLGEDALRRELVGPADEPALGGYLGAYVRWRGSPAMAAARPAWFAALEHLCDWLWTAAMQPVVAHLLARGLDQAVLIPTGLLGLLPLHAACTDDPTRPSGKRYALDDVLFTYAPSARTLAHAQQRRGHVHEATLFAVDDPDGSLRYSDREVADAASHFSPAAVLALAGQAATLARVREQMTRHDVLHFSTHGVAGWAEAQASGLLLAGKQWLTLREIAGMKLEQARLAVLSACETGVPGTDLPDEVTHLPSAFLQAGAVGVVGSLWAVNDPATMMLMARFYDLWREEGTPPPQALRAAQVWIRDSANAEKKAYFEAALPAAGGERMAGETAHAALWDVLSTRSRRAFLRPSLFLGRVWLHRRLSPARP